MECTEQKDIVNENEEIKEEIQEENIEEVEESVDDSEMYDEPVDLQIPRIAKFEKVSFVEFCRVYKPIWIENQKIIAMQNGQDVTDAFGYSEQEFQETAAAIYDCIQLPTRATKGSAGYDFVFPFGRTELVANANMNIPTGIKCNIATGWYLQLVPRSSLGRDFRIQLDNTIGIIDSDYYNSKENEGHIMVKITNDSREGKTCVFETGSRFCQGILVPFGITVDDDVDTERVGGHGSTGR